MNLENNENEIFSEDTRTEEIELKNCATDSIDITVAKKKLAFWWKILYAIGGLCALLYILFL